MKQKLLSRFKLRALMLVTLLCAGFTSAWADKESVTFSEKGYTNGDAVTSYTGSAFSIAFNKGSNSNAPKYYSTGSAIRCYGGNTFTVSSSNTITEIALTFGSGDGTNAITTDGGTYENNTWTGSASAVVFTIGGTTGNRRIASVTVTYSTGGGSQKADCDLALTGAPIALNFDLYNNATAQTIHYTTSSTGEVSVEAGQYDVSCYVDNDAKTISVTPFAVTNGTQTVTVNQAADGTYKAGSVTFTVTVTNSTPIPTHTVTFSINGVTSTQDFEEGGTITFPTNPADIEGKAFVGWVTDAITGTTNTAPSFVSAATMGDADITYYAVFATKTTGNVQAQSMTINAETENIPTSYGDANTFKDYTLNGVKFSIQQVYNNNNILQWRASGNKNGTGTMYNQDELPNLQSIVLTYAESDNNKNFSIKVGSSENPTSGTAVTPSANKSVYTFDCSALNCGYFVLTNGTNAGYLSSIVINYFTGTPDSYSGYCTTVAAETRQNPELSFSPSEVNINFGDQFTAPTLNAAAGFNGTVEYSSSDESVALVTDSETGDLRIMGGGTTTITATFAGNNDFKSGSASYTLNVTDSRIATTITQEDITIDVADIATLTQLTPIVKDANDNVVTYTNSATAEGLPEVYFETVSDVNGILGAFDSHGNIVLNSVVGTATIKAVYNHFQLNDNYRPSECTFTITVESTLNGIAEFCSMESGSTGTVRLTDAEVLYVNGKDMFVRDNTGAIEFYNTGLSYEAGNILNGKITAKYTLYNNMHELTTPISNNTLVATVGSAVTPTEITTSDAADNACNLVKLSGVTVTSNNNKFYVDDVQVYDKFKLSYTIEDGKTYDIVGIMIPYNGTYEICPTEAPTEIVATTPSIDLGETSIHAYATGTDGVINVGYNNITDVVAEVHFFEADGTTSATYDWVTASINSNNNVEYVINPNTGDARTAYFKVYALDDDANDVYSELITVTQDAYVAPAADYADLPFAFDEGRADIEDTDGLTQEGLDTDYNSSPKLKFNSTDDYVLLHFDERPGTLTFDIKGNTFSGGTFKVQTSEDGITYTDLETYTELGNTQSEEFTNLGENVRYIKWIYTEKVSGNVALGNIALAAYVAPQTYTLSWNADQHVSDIFIFDSEDQSTPLTSGDEVLSGHTIIVSVDFESDYELDELSINNGAVTATWNDTEAYYSFTMPAEATTISVTSKAKPVEGKWVKTDLAALTSDDVFVIVSTKGSVSYAMSNNNGTSAAPDAVDVTVAGNSLSGTIANNLIWTVSGNATDGYSFYPYGDTEKWLYCNNSNNGVRVGTNEAKVFSLDGGYLKHDGTSRYVGVYNSSDWRCYTSNTGNSNIAGQTFAFYKFNADYTRTATVGNYGTICLPRNGQVVGAELYSIAGKSEDSNSDITSISLAEVTGNLEAGKPYIFKATTNKILVAYTSNDVAASADSDNGLVGSFSRQLLDNASGNLYVIKNNQVCKVGTGVYVGENKAYIDASQIVNSGTNGVKIFAEGVIDAIDGINGEIRSGVIYNIAGQRLQRPVRGINIINGKKVLVK